MEHKKITYKLKETTRIEAFSDGVIAIAITLLVLELIATLDPESEEGLLNTLKHNWRSFLAFIIGFITILICWINHHLALDHIEKVDTKFMWINGFLLFIVTLTPFSTAIFAEYLEKEGHLALAIFGLNYFLISLAADMICTYSYNHKLIKEDQRGDFRAYKIIYRYAIFYSLVALFICFVSQIIAIILYFILFSFFANPREFASRLAKLKTRKNK